MGEHARHGSASAEADVALLGHTDNQLSAVFSGLGQRCGESVNAGDYSTLG